MSVGAVYLPGEELCDLKESESSGKIFLGPGLRRTLDNTTVTCPGILKYKEPNTYWINSFQKRVCVGENKSLLPGHQ